MAKDRLEQARSFLDSSHAGNHHVGIVGDLALDRFVFGEVDRISPEAPVPVLKSLNVEERLGCAANVFSNAASLAKDFSLNLHLVSVLGSDDTAKCLLRMLNELSPTSDFQLTIDPSRRTPLKTRYIAGSQHQLLRVDEESADKISPQIATELEKKTESVLGSLKVLVLQDYSKGLLNHDLGASLIRRSREKGVFCIVDPNKRTQAKVYTGASLITPNVDEAESLLGRSLDKGSDDAIIEEALWDLKKNLSLENVMITRSKHGLSLLMSDDRVVHLPALAKEVFDVTGAGDTVVAVLASCLAAGAPLDIAAFLANVASSIVVGKVGTASVSAMELREALSNFHV